MQPNDPPERSLAVRVSRLTREQRRQLETHGCQYQCWWEPATITFPEGTRRLRLPASPGLDLVVSYHTILPDGFCVTETALSATMSVLFADPVAMRAASMPASRPASRRSRLARLSSALFGAQEGVDLARCGGGTVFLDSDSVMTWSRRLLISRIGWALVLLLDGQRMGYLLIQARFIERLLV